ncbi:MAG: hypothetical protein WC044_01605 [Crocinitomicaceae bacterium]
MKDKIIRPINGKDYLIGYTSMMAPTAHRETNRVFKMLRLVPKDSNLEGDIFFFEFDNDEWILLPDFGFVNLQDPHELIKLYSDISHKKRITFDAFINELTNKH